jgi:hypothetical protein
MLPVATLNVPVPDCDCDCRTLSVYPGEKGSPSVLAVLVVRLLDPASGRGKGRGTVIPAACWKAVSSEHH